MDRKDLVFLLIDDNPMMLKMLVPMLQGLGYQNFVLAYDGLEGWKQLKKADPKIDVVISDLIMPKASGIELLAKIRNSDQFWDLPFVMVTGDDHQNSLMSSVEVDVSSYIIKPFTPEKLEEEISQVLNEKFNPSDFTRLLQQGRECLVVDNDADGALRCFSGAKQLSPREAEPYYFAGIVYDRQGDYEKAKTELKRCIELREGYVKAYDLLALVYRRERNYLAEKKVLETVTELSPDNPERNINLALACVNTGDHESVKKYLQKAGRLAKGHGVAMFEKIFRTYLLVDDYVADAEGVYRKYIDKKMNNPRLLNKFALILKKHGAYDTAIYFLEQIVEIWTKARAHDIPEEDMAVYYFNLAVTYSERAKKLSGEDTQAGFKQAEKFVNKAIDCDPEHQDARKLYAWLDEHIIN